MTKSNNQQQKPLNLKRFSIYADMDKIDTTWAKYGDTFAPKVILYNDNPEPVQTREKIWMNNGEYMDDLSKGYAFIPNTYVDELLEQAGLEELGLDILKRHESHNGRTVHWTVLSKKKTNVKKGEDFQVGEVIRNGCGTNVSLGVDVYTYRLQCLNGAVYKRKMHGFSLPHIHNVDYMIKRVKYLMAQAIDIAADEVMKLYQKAETIKVDDKIANQLYKKMLQANHYLPDSWEIIPYKEVKQIRKEGKMAEFDGLVKVKSDLNLYQTFNEITTKQRNGLDRGVITFAAVSKHQVSLHNGMMEIVAQHK